ncbi:hypothetical protein [Pseudoruegeria sp. HB172150]|uniref:hypothetical protein n=1 Tax=Pseudoruegeria sp. HB172150 TaxID=2721164 RepID=UPI001553C19B|nr:hypothetical protein [Pseudoruegeria sp. HB172150]
MLSVAARTGRLGVIVLEGPDLIYWSTSAKGSKSADAAALVLRGWIAEFRPNVLISENPDAAGRKRGRQIPILKAFVDLGTELSLPHRVVERRRLFNNAHQEAAAFVRQFPDAAPTAHGKPPIWGKEPHNLVCFEALALARDAGCIEATEPDAPEDIPG